MPMIFTLQPAGDTPLGGLPRAAQALVVGLRGWVSGWRAAARGDAGGHAQWEGAWSTFATSLGPAHGRVATGTLAAFVAALAAGARRPLDIRPTCCAGLSHDERALLALVQAAGARSATAESRARALWLVRADHVQPLLVHAADLGRAVTATGLALGGAPGGTAEPESRGALEACQDEAVPIVVPPLSEAGD